MPKLTDKHRIAIHAAYHAAKVIMEVYQENISPTLKLDGSPVTKADLASSRIIHEQLEKTGIPVTGEEVKKESYEQRKYWNECWCVDPLDGTKEFIKKNGEFVVSIALIRNNRPVFGILASPVAQKMLVGGSDLGAAFMFKFSEIDTLTKWRKLSPLEELNNPLVIISSRSHYSGNLLKLAEQLEDCYGTIATAKMGSALKFFDLAMGKADVYPRFAPTMEWDIAAGQAIYEVLGGEVLSLETGQPLTYNKENLYNSFFIARKKSLRFSIDQLCE